MHFDPQLRDIPVMMVSAVVSSEEDELLPTGENGRVDAFMSKPLDPSALLRRVADLMQEG
jgi:response regulator RpfG family c-di-GMP phosphodiesterase